ncbi:ATP-binding protein [Flavobacteriales bacterium]|nr:ATP-binding protein [Flavobacteriales bacterium]
MNTDSPRELAAYIAFITAAALGFGLLVTNYIFSLTTNWFSIVIVDFLTALVVYFASKYSIEQFIFERIKLIYKTINRTKQQQGQQPEITPDMLNTVEKDVQQWMEDNNSAINQLELKEAFSREYTGNVAHELKTPIFNIQGYILTLLEGGLEDESINRKYLQRAEKSVERMINLIDDLDTITRIEAKQLHLKISKENIVDIAEDVIESLEDSAKKSDIKLKFDRTYDALIHVSCDKKRIIQVLTNLVVNSIKYGKDNGTTEIRFYNMDDTILVEVSDDGLGIEEQFLPRLFERFYRIEESRARDTGGTGLGLAIVKHIIDAHQQTINVRSTIGVGSTFSFTLAKA